MPCHERSCLDDISNRPSLAHDAARMYFTRSRPDLGWKVCPTRQRTPFTSTRTTLLRSISHRQVYCPAMQISYFVEAGPCLKDVISCRQRRTAESRLRKDVTNIDRYNLVEKIRRACRLHGKSHGNRAKEGSKLES